MTADRDKLRASLRALMESPAAGIADYASDPLIGRRVGRILADAQARHNAAAHRANVPAPEMDPALFKASSDKP